MNWLDIILLIILIKSAVQGFCRGFVVSAFKTAGVVVALFVGIFYRDDAVSFLNSKLAIDRYLSSIILLPTISDSEALSVINVKSIMELVQGAIGFFLVFLLVQLVFLIPAHFISGIIKISGLTLLDRLMGTVFGIAGTALWFALISAVTSPFLMLFPGSILDKGISTSYILNHLRFLDFISPIVVKLI
ncbi:MAG TPA: CvpA family protein [Thermoanaerobacterales bacterium]|nr:CvpA family protein [Thermoanaerobacterales bacterium]